MIKIIALALCVALSYSAVSLNAKVTVDAAVTLEAYCLAKIVYAADLTAAETLDTTDSVTTNAAAVKAKMVSTSSGVSKAWFYGIATTVERRLLATTTWTFNFCAGLEATIPSGTDVKFDGLWFGFATKVVASDAAATAAAQMAGSTGCIGVIGTYQKDAATTENGQYGGFACGTVGTPDATTGALAIALATLVDTWAGTMAFASGTDGLTTVLKIWAAVSSIGLTSADLDLFKTDGQFQLTTGALAQTSPASASAIQADFTGTYLVAHTSGSSS